MTRLASIVTVALLAARPVAAVGQTPTLVVVDQPPQQIAGTCKPPAYPEILRQAGIEGTVALEFVIGLDGVPDSASLRVTQTSHPLFVTPARTALLTCRYQPGRAGGQPIRTLSSQIINFRLARPDSTRSRP